MGSDFFGEDESENFEPSESERVYYRHVQTGDRGYAVRRDGQEHIRYDRPSSDMTVIHRQGQWVPEALHHTVPEIQLARIAFEADKVLCALLNMYKESKREWLALKNEEKIEWMRQGPEGNDHRRRLYLSIMDAVQELGE